MATAAASHLIHCKLPQSLKPSGRRRETTSPVLKINSKSESAKDNSAKILLQPRLCTLRSYGSDLGLIKTRSNDVSPPFFEKLYEYIESSNDSHDFEILSGRLAMVVFAATVTTEVVTGNSIFGKTDLQGIAEAVGVCLAAVTCAATFAWFYSARTKVGRLFTLSCNTFIDLLIDQIVDGLFYESELKDWSDEI